MVGRCIKVEEKIFHYTNVEVPMTSPRAGHVTGRVNIWKNKTYYSTIIRRKDLLIISKGEA